jgi:hypothetical protein
VRFEVVPFAAESQAGWLRQDRDFLETSSEIPVRQVGALNSEVSTMEVRSMEEIYWYRVERKFRCGCGQENLLVGTVNSKEFKTEDEVGFVVSIQPLPKCSKCGQFHAGDLGIGVVRISQPDNS